MDKDGKLYQNSDIADTLKVLEITLSEIKYTVVKSTLQYVSGSGIKTTITMDNTLIVRGRN
jgi:hypothetical protein